VKLDGKPIEGRRLYSVEEVTSIGRIWGAMSSSITQAGGERGGTDGSPSARWGGNGGLSIFN